MPFDGTEVGTDRAAVLRRAANLLEDQGWCRYTLRDREGRHCAMGALLAARDVPVDLVWSRAIDMRVAEKDAAAVARHLGLEQVVAGSRHPWWETVATWNNYEARDRDEVVAALRGAAAACP